MSTRTGPSPETRMLTPAELGFCIRMFRESQHWSQEQLAEIAKLNVRTIQRVEQGQGASLDTRRALASAFGSEDIDIFDKPFTIPTEEYLKAQKEQFDREHVTLNALPLTTGQQLARLAEDNWLDYSESGFELNREARKKFAELIDYFRDYRDCADLYIESAKLDVHDELQTQIDALKTLGVSLCYAERKSQVKWGTNSDAKPMPANAMYLIAFPLGKEPKQFTIPKAASINL